MCKVMMVAGIKQKNINNAKAFMEVMGGILTVGNKDGLGYVAMNKDGALFGKRWLDNDYAFFDSIEPDPAAVSVNKKFPGLLEDTLLVSSTPEMNSFGNEQWEDVVSVMLHTRYATSAKGMANTHPFVTLDNSTALIHNGVIRNERDFKLTLSTCDSEAILVSYLEQNVIDDPSNIQFVANSLEGYYAAGIMSSQLKALDIIHYNARLSFAYVKELGAYVFTTDGKDITTACEALGFKHDSVFEFKSKQFLRLDAITGNMIKLLKFTDKPYVAPTYQGAHVYNGGNNFPKTMTTTSNALAAGAGSSRGSLRRLAQHEVQETIMQLLAGGGA